MDNKTRSELTLREMLVLDKGWVPFEIDEHGYLLALVVAWQEVFNGPEALSMDYILKLHGLATNKVEGTNYDLGHEQRGHLRNAKSDMYFLLNKGCASEAGIKEFLDRKHPDQAIELKLYDKEKNWLGTITINAASLHEIQNFEYSLAINKKPGFEMYYDYSRLRKYCDADSTVAFIKSMEKDPILRRVIGDLGKAKDNQEAAHSLYHWIESHHSYAQLFFSSSQGKYGDDWPGKLKQDLQEYIDIYVRDIKNQKTPIDKLRVIVKFIQACELLHPFHDGNGRTFCMLLLNHLLVREGFPMAILSDSNHFNLYSQDEMLRNVVKGMSNTMTLIKEGKLFDVLTQDIVRTLNSNPHFHRFFADFAEAVAVEEYGRREKNSSKSKQ